MCFFTEEVYILINKDSYKHHNVMNYFMHFRFEQITTYMHVGNPATELEPDHESYDKVQTVRTLVNLPAASFKAQYCLPKTSLLTKQ